MLLLDPSFGLPRNFGTTEVIVGEFQPGDCFLHYQRIVQPCHDLTKSAGGWGLRKVRAGTQVIRLRDIALFRRRCEDDHVQVGTERLFLNPFEHFETAFERQLQIQQHEDRKWILRAVDKLSLPSQKVHRLLAVGDHMQGVVKLGVFESASQYEYVVVVILHDQNWQAFSIRVWTRIH